MSTLRFGWHMPSFPVDGSSGPRFVEQVRASLDRLHPHFESVWVDDHLWPWAGWQPADTPFLECVSTIAHFATVYRDLTFGSFVFCQSYRTPAVLAKTAANLQLLTGGRYVFGIGAGWVEREYHAYDYEFPKPAVRIAQLDEEAQRFSRAGVHRVRSRTRPASTTASLPSIFDSISSRRRNDVSNLSMKEVVA
ncbi:MAG: LLM class flavin-dependent oxidoreductase [Spirochaetaceae bacterium]|nr:LLM class flavin-dependent oxidoreductase [Spirochaetaceae bacterium]